MALTTTQKNILDNLDKYIPAFKRAALTESNRIKLGTKLAYEIASTSPSAIADADADETYGAAEATMLNNLKTQVNLIVTLLEEIKTALNA